MYVTLHNILYVCPLYVHSPILHTTMYTEQAPTHCMYIRVYTQQPLYSTWASSQLAVDRHVATTAWWRTALYTHQRVVG